MLAAYPYLEREDILEALTYAAWRPRRKNFRWPRDQSPDRHESDAAVGGGFYIGWLEITDSVLTGTRISRFSGIWRAHGSITMPFIRTCCLGWLMANPGLY